MYEYKAHVTRVIDGDTFDATVDLGFDVNIGCRFRLNGIDTPEIFGTEKPLGDKAKAYVESVMSDKVITIKSIKTDKYGRYLADVTLADGTYLNKDLLDKGYAKPYTGSGPKPDWTVG